MAVTPKQLREGAQKAELDGPEVERRVAVSRTYYAAFHRCRAIAQRQGMFADAGGTHAEVIEALTRSRKRKLQSIGYMLRQCRELRVKADYQIGQGRFLFCCGWRLRGAWHGTGVRRERG